MSVVRQSSQSSTAQPAPLGERDRVVMVLTGALGDVARGVIVPTQLKRWYPNLHITWLVEDKWRDVVELCPAVDEVMLYSRKGSLFGFPGVSRVFRQAGPFHLALDLGRHFKSGCFTILSGAPRRVGFHRENSKEGNWLFQTHTISPVSETESKVLHYEQFVKVVVGERYISPARDEYFSVDTKRAQNLALELLKSSGYGIEKGGNHKIIVLSLGSSWSSKDWPLSGYEALIGKLDEHEKFHVVLTGDKRQVKYGERLQSAGGQRVCNLTGRTSLQELIGLLSLADIAAGPDTGTGHLASLVTTPYIGLFGPTDPRRVAPFGSEHLALASLVPCRPCKRRVCPGLNNACMRLLSPIMVYESILRVLENARRSELKILGG